MAASLAALNTLSADGNAAYAHLNKMARMLREGLEEAVARLHAPAMYQTVGAVGGQPVLYESQGDHRLQGILPGRFQHLPALPRELMKRGVYLHPLQSEPRVHLRRAHGRRHREARRGEHRGNQSGRVTSTPTEADVL